MGGHARRIGAVVLGAALTIGGIVLLVLPGPGFVLIALGLALLATQFSWARPPLEYAKRKAWQGLDQVGRSGWGAALAGVTGAVLLVVGLLPLLGVQLPVIGRLTGIFLVLSGLFLVGTLVYGRSAKGRMTVRRHLAAAR